MYRPFVGRGRTVLQIASSPSVAMTRDPATLNERDGTKQVPRVPARARYRSRALRERRMRTSRE